MAKAPTKRKPGPSAKQSKAEAGRKQRERVAANQAAATRANQDIAEGFRVDQINWERRKKCRNDPRAFGYEYLPNVFYLSLGRDHQKVLEKGRKCIMQTGKFSIAMPRGNGKTAWCRCFMIWATAYAWKLFPFFLGSNQDKAKATLEFVKAYWSTSEQLRQDFPEIAYPISCLDGRHHRAKGQLFKGHRTHIEWGSESIRYPCLQLPPEIAEIYRKNDPESLLRNRDGSYFKVGENFVPASAGIYIKAVGIEGSIRGEADIHPVTLAQPRPDIVLADDIQKDVKAHSPAECKRLTDLIDGAVSGLSGPDVPLSVLMPCTVTREGDVSDTYLERDEYVGERCSMVEEWPDGLDDYAIDPESSSGRLWLKYDELRRKSFNERGDISLASEYYLKHQRQMDAGFVLAWPDRFNGAERYEGNREYSGIQHAMNKRFESPSTFPAEFQNRPKDLNKVEIAITPEILAERTNKIPRLIVPSYATRLVSMIDVQNEHFCYMTLACSDDFTGAIIDYGTFPDVGMPYFQRRQFNSWSLLSRRFFERYPNQSEKAETISDGSLRAPLEAKVYYGLSEVVKLVLAKDYRRDDHQNTKMELAKLGIDSRWGKASNSIRRYIHDQKDARLMAMFGTPVTPGQRQFEEYTLTSGWRFEHIQHRGLKECTWIWKFGPDGHYYLATDVNRLKTFAMSRLACPIGSPGAIVLHKGSPEQHRLVSEHIAGSEEPIEQSERGRKKEMWFPKDGEPDNEFLDTFVGCLALASFEGARIRESDESPVQNARNTGRSLKDIYHANRGKRLA